MSHFYGRVSGTASSDATRCGTKTIGITATVRSWDGNVTTALNHHDDRDVAQISLRPEHGNTTHLGSFDHGRVMHALQVGDKRTQAAAERVAVAIAKLDAAAARVKR